MSYVYPPVPSGRPTGMATTNTKAVVAMCVVWSFPLLGLVFGVKARNEIRVSGEGGSGFATTGIVVGAIATGLLVLYVLGLVAVFAFGVLGAFGTLDGSSGF